MSVQNVLQTGDFIRIVMFSDGKDENASPANAGPIGMSVPIRPSIGPTFARKRDRSSRRSYKPSHSEMIFSHSNSSHSSSPSFLTRSQKRPLSCWISTGSPLRNASMIFRRCFRSFSKMKLSAKKPPRETKAQASPMRSSTVTGRSRLEDIQLRICVIFDMEFSFDDSIHVDDNRAEQHGNEEP